MRERILGGGALARRLCVRRIEVSKKNGGKKYQVKLEPPHTPPKYSDVQGRGRTPCFDTFLTHD